MISCGIALHSKESIKGNQTMEINQTVKTCKTTKMVCMQADLTKYFDDLATLEDYSQNIVKIKVLQNENQNIQYDNENAPLYGQTFTVVKVKKAYKSSDDLVDKTITVREGYFTITDSLGNKTVYTIDAYRPLVVGETYILFLSDKSADNSSYGIVGLYQGKFVANKKTDEINEKNTEIGANAFSEKFKKLFADVENKYK